jgi:hypothetical protein
MQPDLSDEDITDLAKLIKRTIDASRYPFSPEVRRWKELLATLRPEPPREPLPAPKRYEPASNRQKAPTRPIVRSTRKSLRDGGMRRRIRANHLAQIMRE